MRLTATLLFATCWLLTSAAAAAAPSPAFIGMEVEVEDLGTILHVGGTADSSGIGTMGTLTIDNSCPSRGGTEYVYTWMSQDFTDPASHHQWYQGGWAQIAADDCVAGHLFWGTYDYTAGGDVDFQVLATTPESVGDDSEGTFYIAFVNDAGDQNVGFSNAPVGLLNPLGIASGESICQINVYYGISGSSEGTAYYTDEYTGDCAVQGNSAWVYEISSFEEIQNYGSTSDPTLTTTDFAWLERDDYLGTTLYVTPHQFAAGDQEPYSAWTDCPDYGSTVAAGGGEAGPGVGC